MCACKRDLVVSTPDTHTSAQVESASEASRASRGATRAGRIVRILRLVRLIRIAKLFKVVWRMMKGAPEEELSSTESDEELEGDQRLSVGKRLSELTTRRVIIIVLTMLFGVPQFIPTTNFDLLPGLTTFSAQSDVVCLSLPAQSSLTRNLL